MTRVFAILLVLLALSACGVTPGCRAVSTGLLGAGIGGIFGGWTGAAIGGASGAVLGGATSPSAVRGPSPLCY
jgi:osmotically inducible lipoprotein OsmB